jgi:acetylglutamate kinase
MPNATHPIVIKIGGSILEDLHALAPLWRALVRLASPAGDGPARLVLVHGGGKAVDALLARLNLPVARKQGLRVTPPDQIDLVAGVLAGAVNKKLVGAFSASGGRAVGLCLGDGPLLAAAPMTAAPDGTPVDLGRVGVVTGGSPRLLTTLLQGGYIPIVSSIGIDASGGMLNLNADDAAGALASALPASRLILLTDVPGIKGADGGLIESASLAAIDGLIASGVITGGMIPKVRAAADVARRGIPVTIMSGDDPGALQHVAAGGSAGTTILPQASP